MQFSIGLKPTLEWNDLIPLSLVIAKTVRNLAKKKSWTAVRFNMGRNTRMPASNDRDSRAPGSIFKIEFRASQESTVRMIHSLDHGLRRQPEHDCLRDASGTFSHRDVELLTHRVAHALRAAGLEKEARASRSIRRTVRLLLLP